MAAKRWKSGGATTGKQVRGDVLNEGRFHPASSIRGAKGNVNRRRDSTVEVKPLSQRRKAG